MPPPPYPPPIKPEDFCDKIDDAFVGKPTEARVARVADSLGKKHYNTLVPPSYGVAYVQLNAGSAQSTSFGGTEQKKAKDDFHYAAGSEQLTLKYRMDDPKGVILAARIELYRRFDETPLWKRDLTDDERADGDHSFKFELGTDPNEHFPDLVPTAEHSPYKLKITTSSNIRPQSPCAWTYFQVLVHDVQLELGSKTVLPRDAAAAGGITPGSHRTLYDSLAGKLPKDGETTKLELIGNLFKTDSGEMYSNAGYDLHKTQWGDGPLIPIFAKLRLRKADDTPVESPLGLGNVKCLWDWEDAQENPPTGLDAAPSAFVNRSVNYDRDLTKPKGNNCHQTRGGKRNGSGSTDPIFPVQAGYDPKPALDETVFPFKVEAATTRKWAAVSMPWRKETLKGKTGVFFQPSRMAGDSYKIACYVAWEKDKDGKLVLDVEEDIKDKTSAKAVSGKFEIWRTHSLNKYVKKKAFAMDIPVAAVQAYYSKTYVNLRKVFASSATMPAGTYNTTIGTLVAAMPAWQKAMVDPAVDQHATGDCCINYRNHGDYLSAYRTARGWTAAQLNTWLAGAGAGISTPAQYESFCDSLGMKTLEAVCNIQMPGTDGVTLCQFIGVHNIGGKGGLNGYAADLASATRQRAAFITCATPDAYSGNANKLEQTTAHEIGHHLFMPHAPDGVGADGGPAPDMHDKDDHNCTMSYNFAAERRWCGFCNLRLRGWDKTTIDKDGTKNSHPLP